MKFALVGLWTQKDVIYAIFWGKRAFLIHLQAPYFSSAENWCLLNLLVYFFKLYKTNYKIHNLGILVHCDSPLFQFRSAFSNPPYLALSLLPAYAFTPFTLRFILPCKSYLTENCDLIDMWFINPSFAQPIAWKCHLRNKSSISDKCAKFFLIFF